MSKKHGKTIVYLGCMFSGKTKRIISDAEKAIIGLQTVVSIKHQSDTRYHRKDLLNSHDGHCMECQLVKSLEHDPPGVEAEKHIDLIVIDEAQFIKGVAAFCRRQNALGRNVHVAGLNSYANQERTPWPEMVPFLSF